MSKRKRLIIFALIVSSLFAVSMVSADVISGTGWFYGHGNGEVVIRGETIDTLHITGNGTLLFKDDGETDIPAVAGYGRKVELANGWVKYEGFHGVFHLTDADLVTVRLEGRNLNIYAAGEGEIWLRGNGRYRTGSDNLEAEGAWNETGVTVNVSPTE